MNFFSKEPALSFDDVLLLPQHSDIVSRSEVSMAYELENIEGHIFRLPVVSSPMDTVTEFETAKQMFESGGFGIVHRYLSEIEQKNISLKCAEQGIIAGFAVGTGSQDRERARFLIEDGLAEIICVDVAHGHHIAAAEMVSFLSKNWGDQIHIMAGNVATLEGFNFLADAGAHSVRVGIGGGSICSTRIQTGHGCPTLQSVIDCAKSDRDALLIADGGIRTAGDIVKALGAGADLVMLGSMLAGTDCSPGDIIEHDNGEKCMEYRGMASRRAQTAWRGKVASKEGVASHIPYKGELEAVIADIQDRLRSGLSYSGARSIEQFQNTALFIMQTSAGWRESNTHISSLAKGVRD